jgi:hypothetical protein
MMEMRPGVALSEGGKVYGGLSYNHLRENQKDLASYKSQKDTANSKQEAKTADMIKRIK